MYTQSYSIDLIDSKRSKLFNDYLMLVGLGVGHRVDSIPDISNWQAIKALAMEQGLNAIILDGVEKLPTGNKPPQVFLLEWIGQVIQGNEGLYAMCRRTLTEMASFYNANGFKMMVLKGYACGLDWPRPERRPYGDIDIWLFGRQEEADAVLSKGKGIKIDKSHHHHTVFEWNGFTVENHYNFVNVHAHRSSAEMEKIFKELGSENNLNPNVNDNSVGKRIDCVEVDGQMVYLPSPNLHALFLMKHMASHFAAVGITLRQVLDWAFFVEKHTDEVDWKWFDGLLVKYHLKEFFNCINAICVENLEFELNLNDNVNHNDNHNDNARSAMPLDSSKNHNYLANTNPSNDTNFNLLKKRVLEDILNPQFTSAEPDGFVLRMIHKYRRWQGNAWKQKLCYEESRWSAFWTLLRSHLIKP